MAQPLLVFADDWGRHPSSAQHLVTPLLQDRTVIWVHTIGTRPLRWDVVTFRRGLGKLREWSDFGRHRTRQLHNRTNLSPQIVAPRMWPSFRSRFARKLNQRLLTRTLTPLLKLQAEAPIVLTTIPLVADLVGRLPVAGWVYYCVDDFGSWPGYDGITLAAMERELVPRMDATIAVSTTLQQNLKRLGGANPELLTHGVSLEQWSYQGTPPIELHGFEQPLILFWGLIDQRLDVEWLTVLSQRMTQGTILLLGPIDTFSPAIQQLPHVRRLPAMPVERLPEFAASAQVLIMPYRDIPATRAMQPLKLMEYLATDKPVVVRSLPSTVEWSDCCDVVENANLFAQRVLECFRGDLCNAQRLARDRLREHNWNSKSAWLSRFLDSVAVRTGTPHPTFMQSRKS